MRDCRYERLCCNVLALITFVSGVLSPALAEAPASQFDSNVEADFRRLDAGAVARKLTGKTSGFVSALDLCGATSVGRPATKCLQNAVAAVCTRSAFRGGGTIYLPAGRYVLDATVTVPCDGVLLVGAGIGNRDNDQTGTAIVCTVIEGVNFASVYGNVFAGFTSPALVNRSAGAHIETGSMPGRVHGVGDVGCTPSLE